VHGVDKYLFPQPNYKLDVSNGFLLGIFCVDENHHSLNELEAGVDACK